MDMISFVRLTVGYEPKERAWNEVVDNIILPRIAGSQVLRHGISDKYMSLVAHYTRDIYQKDCELATILMKIALERLSRGAVIHAPFNDSFKLSGKYAEYSSKFDEPHPISKGCISFLLNDFELCFQDSKLHNHAQAIMFGLMECLDRKGSRRKGYMFYHPKKVAQQIFETMEDLAEKYCDFETLFSHYACPSQWEKHLKFFAENASNIDWNVFFQKTEIGKDEDALTRLQLQKHALATIFPHS